MTNASRIPKVREATAIELDGCIITRCTSKELMQMVMISLAVTLVVLRLRGIKAKLGRKSKGGRSYRALTNDGGYGNSEMTDIC